MKQTLILIIMRMEMDWLSESNAPMSASDMFDASQSSMRVRQ